jgi:hypothetical protein
MREKMNPGALAGATEVRMVADAKPGISEHNRNPSTTKHICGTPDGVIRVVSKLLKGGEGWAEHLAMPPEMPIAPCVIMEMSRDEVHSITVALGGRWHGDYGVAFCPAHDNTRTPALSLSSGREGCLLAKCHAGCNFQAIIDALHGLGPVGWGEHRAFDRMPAAQTSVAERAKTAKRAALTEKLWTNARPIAGSVAEIYLRGRGITCAVPETLRFAPSCWHLSARRYPGLIAKLEGAPAFAVHRTYLHPDGAGKADASPQKTVLGPCAGGAVRLSKDPGPLVVAEGIETALSLASGLLQETGRVADLATLNDTGDGSVNLGEAEVAAKWLTPALGDRPHSRPTTRSGARRRRYSTPAAELAWPPRVTCGDNGHWV